MSDSIRTFVAVEMAPAVRDAAVAVIDDLRKAGADVKWVARENMHLTLQFLGQVPADTINDVCLAVTEALAGEPACPASGSDAPMLGCRLVNYGKYLEDGWSHLPSIGVHYVFLSAPPLGEKPRRTNPTFNFSEGFTCTPSA